MVVDPSVRLHEVTAAAAKWRRIAVTEAVTLVGIVAAAAIFWAMSFIKPDLLDVANEYGFDTGYGDTSESISITWYGIFGQLRPMLDDLGFPPGTMSRMESTRALDGTLEAQGDNVSVTWTYHPDDGLQMVFQTE